MFSHPRDFTPVCSTELGRVAQLDAEWKKRGVRVAALSVDNNDNHIGWIKDINEISKTSVEFPIIADPDRKVSYLYGMISQNHLNDAGMPVTVRSVFIIGPDKKVKTIITYPASTGRNFDEIIRVIDSLQLSITGKPVATGADWTKGQKCLVLPNISNEDAQKLFPAGVEVVRPWLRLVNDPSSV